MKLGKTWRALAWRRYGRGFRIVDHMAVRYLRRKRNCPILFLCFDPPGKEPSIQLISRSSLVWIYEADRKHTIENTFVSFEARVWIL